MSIAKNIKAVSERIERACQKSNRDPKEIKLVAVTKNVDADRIIEAISAGVSIIGENRVQEAWQKYQSIERQVHWHMIGHLQTNKVKRVLQFANVVQSVDSTKLAREIHRQAEKLDRTVEILIQVNTSDEESKFGFAPGETIEAVDEISKFSRLRIQGLMTIAVYSPNRDEVRACFRMLREIREKVKAHEFAGVEMDVLSMGMTDDFEIAIEEGSTMVRIGRSIFGERPI